MSENPVQNLEVNQNPALSDSPIDNSLASLTSQRDFIVIGSRLLAQHPDLIYTTINVFRDDQLQITFELPKNEFQGAVIVKEHLYVLTSVYGDKLDAEFLPSKITQYDLKNLKSVQSISLDHSRGLVFLPNLNRLVTFTTTSQGNIGWTLIQSGSALQSSFQQNPVFSTFYNDGITGSDSLIDLHLDASTGKITSLHKSVIPNTGNKGKQYIFYLWDDQNLSLHAKINLTDAVNFDDPTGVSNSNALCYPQPTRISSIPKSLFLIYDPGCDKIYKIPSSNFPSSVTNLKVQSNKTEPMNGAAYEGAPFTSITFPEESKNFGKSWALFRNETPSNLGMIMPQSGLKFSPSKFSLNPWAFDQAGVLTNDKLWAVVEAPSANEKMKFAIRSFILNPDTAPNTAPNTAKDLIILVNDSPSKSAKWNLFFDHGETPLFLQSIPSLK